MYETVIAGGTVVTAAAVFEADVAVSGEQIAAVGLGLAGERVVDARGCLVIPGAVDVHVHLQMNVGKYTSSDTFQSGTVAAAHGGTTTVVDFVEPAIGESMLAALGERRAEANGQVAVDYGLHMAVPAWQVDHALDEIPAVMQAGICSFKLYQAYGPLCLDDTRLYAVLKALARYGGLPILHSENGPLIDLLRAEALAAGHIEPIWHARTRPASLEAESVRRAIEVARLAGSPLYIVHVSCAAALEEIVAARQRGQQVLGETCPQYLFLSQDYLEGAHAKRFICAPPLRTAGDQDTLWGALASGSLQVVSSDHCPFMSAEKVAESDFVNIPGGVPAIEPRLSLVYQAVRDGRMSLSTWVDRCCSSPARLFKLQDKGQIAPGFDADLVIFDPSRPVELGSDFLHERADWTPYEGRELVGWPRQVLSRGELVVDDGRFLGAPGRGRYVRAG